MEAILLNKVNENAAYADHVKHKLKLYMEAMFEAGLNRIIIGSGNQEYRFRDDLGIPYFTSAYFSEFVSLPDHLGSFLVIEEGQPPALFIQHHDDYWHSEPAALKPDFAVQFDIHEYVGEPDFGVQGGTAYIGKSLSELPTGIAETAVLNPEKLLAYIDFHRAWKTVYEQDCLKAANQKAAPAHLAAEKAFRQGCSEYEIHMTYLLAANSRDKDLPYDSIVALNTNAAVLHHMHLSTERPDESRSFLIDAGASVRGYGSDISRTYYAENAHPEFIALVKGVDALQQKLVSEVRPGKSYVDIHVSAHQHIASLLLEIGIIECSVDEALASGLTRAFFPHGVGHLLGVQVHDRGGHMASQKGITQLPPKEYPALRLTRTIEENMVFTIEPGVYFISSLLQPWQQNSQQGSILNHELIEELMPYGGVRIEDNVLVGKESVENLTRDAFAA